LRGKRDERNGIRFFVARIGGKPALNLFGAHPDNSQVRNDKTPGVLRLKSFTDSGTDRCH